MKYYECVSQYTKNLFLEPFTMRAQSVRIRTDTTLDQYCEGNCAGMYSLHDRVIVDNMYEFQHSSSRAGYTFSMQDSRVKRGTNIGHKTQQARLPAHSGLHNSTFPSLVNCISTIQSVEAITTARVQGQHGPDIASDLSITLARHLVFFKVLRQSLLGVIQFTRFPVACYSCFAYCCHDPFFVRSASNLSTVSWVSLSWCIRLDVRDQ